MAVDGINRMAVFQLTHKAELLLQTSTASLLLVRKNYASHCMTITCATSSALSSISYIEVCILFSKRKGTVPISEFIKFILK